MTPPYTYEQHKAECNSNHWCGVEPEHFDMPLFRKAIEWVTTQHELGDKGLWYQPAWRVDSDCGTKYCVAGYVCEVSGMDWRPSGLANLQLVYTPDRGALSPGYAARNALGLFACEAEELFDGLNTYEQVMDVANMIAARRGERL